MSKQSNNSSTGIGLTGLVFLLFLALKLTGIVPVADWSWWWITAPLWGPITLVLLGLGIYLLLYLAFDNHFKK